MHVIKTNFRANPNVGLYAFATDDYCLIGPEVPDTEVERLKATLEVPILRTTIAGTGLVGVFCAGNNNHLLVPHIIFDKEEQFLQKHKINYSVITTDLTALGNNILCNDFGCLVSPEYPDKERKAIEKALGMSAKPFKIGELDIIGSCAAATNTGCLTHRGTLPFEREMIETTLKVPVTTGTLNLGNPYVKSGLIANKHGLVVGDMSGGPEIVNAEEALRGE